MASLATWLRTFGINPRRAVSSLRGIGRYRRDRKRYLAELGTDFVWGESLPILDEWDAASGALGAYFFQDQLVARWIHDAQPRRHVDVGSRLDGFIGHLAVFREVEVIDIRPQPVPVSNVTFHQLDLMEKLPPRWLAATDSLSCLHTLEHFGLGRYGDPLDPLGTVKACRELKRVLAPGGNLYFGLPIGRPRVCFNAHRIHSPDQILEYFSGLKLLEFSLVDDAGHFRQNIEPAHGRDLKYGCGLFQFTK